ncbi:MAG: hypothetical protein LBH81_00330 [Rickettsiales bacterium]|jgi:hypothetical protein|nr:hypothetical protein [Rickettsiales bacterium]
MQKIVLGFVGALAVGSGVANAATTRGSAMQSLRNVAPSAPAAAPVAVVSAEPVRATAPAAPISSVAAARAPSAAGVSVVNPNTGNIMEESLLPDGTTLYTDPVSNEKFIMVDGKLVAYIDENDTMIPMLNATVGQARQICQAIQTHGYIGEFNELTYECMVPIVGIGTGGKISSSDGDAVAFYPFGSVIRCDAGIFDSISVMRRNSQYIVPAMIVGGGLAGAGIGFAVDKYQESNAKKGDGAGSSATDKTTTGGRVDISKLTTREEFEKEISRMTNEDVAFWCGSVPKDTIENILSIMNNGKTYNCIAELEFSTIYKIPPQNIAFNMETMAKQLNASIKDLNASIEWAKQNNIINTQCESVGVVSSRIHSIEFAFVDSGKDKKSEYLCNGQPGKMIIMKYNGSYFGKTNASAGKKYAENLKEDLGTFKTYFQDVSSKGLQHFNDRSKEIDQMITAIEKSNLTRSEKDELIAKLRSSQQFYQNTNEKGFFSKIWDSNVGRGAIIGTGVGALGGLAYFFYEGSKTKCDVGGFKTLGLDEVYRMPSFREHIQNATPFGSIPPPVPVIE